MQRRKLSVNLTSSSIAPTSHVSLLGTGWRCLHRDAWEEKQTVFFAENNFFCQNTIFSLGAQKSRSGRSFESSASHDFWIIESGPDCTPVGRVALQVFQGSFRQGLLFLDMGDQCDVFSQDLLSQLITLAFLNSELATLKVVALSTATTKFLGFLNPSPTTTLVTFSRSHLPTTAMQEVYRIEPEAWFDSSQGKDALIRLGWLKKRKEREQSIRLGLAKPKRRTPFLFSLLTLGRRQRI